MILMTVESVGSRGICVVVLLLCSSFASCGGGGGGGGKIRPRRLRA